MKGREPCHPCYAPILSSPTGGKVRPLRRRSPAYESAYSSSYSSYHNVRPRMVEKLYSKFLTQDRLANEAREEAHSRRSRSFIGVEEHCHSPVLRRVTYEPVYGHCKAPEIGYVSQQEIDAESMPELQERPRWPKRSLWPGKQKWQEKLL